MADIPITAVMLTRPQREWRAWRSIDNFIAEGTPGRHLLVYTDDQPYAERLQARFNDQPLVAVRAFSTDPMTMLKFAVSVARERDGYFALWDDDDLFAPGRLARQTKLIEDHPKHWPAFLSAGFWHFANTGEIFVYDLDKRFENLTVRMRLSTLLCQADDRLSTWAKEAKLFPTRSHTSSFGYYVLTKTDCLRPTREYQWMVVGIGEDNACGYEWHRALVSNEHKCKNREWLLEHQTEIEKHLQAFPWEPDAFGMPKLDICGSDGLVFGFTPQRFWPESFPRPAMILPSEIEVVTHDVGQQEESTNAS